MKIYLGKQESMDAVKVPVEDGSDEKHELNGMLKLSMYVKTEDFPDVTNYVKKWMELKKDNESSGQHDSWYTLFDMLDRNNQINLKVAEIVKEKLNEEKPKVGLSSSESV